MFAVVVGGIEGGPGPIKTLIFVSRIGGKETQIETYDCTFKIFWS